MFQELQTLLQNQTLPFSVPSQAHLYQEVRQHALYFSQHKLLQSSKFCSELLMALKPTDGDLVAQTSIQPVYHAFRDFQETPAYDVFLLGQSLFDNREFRKCAYVMQQQGK